MHLLDVKNLRVRFETHHGTVHAVDGVSFHLEEGELIIVPHGVEHRPEALTKDCHVLMLEPKTTLNTGNVVTDKTVTQLDQL